jgi:hypothetical protein
MMIWRTTAGGDREAYPNLALIAIYGGILRLARCRGHDLLHRRKSRNWISEKIVLKQRDEITTRSNLTSS